MAFFLQAIRQQKELILTLPEMVDVGMYQVTTKDGPRCWMRGPLTHSLGGMWRSAAWAQLSRHAYYFAGLYAMLVLGSAERPLSFGRHVHKAACSAERVCLSFGGHVRDLRGLNGAGLLLIGRTCAQCVGSAEWACLPLGRRVCSAVCHFAVVCGPGVLLTSVQFLHMILSPHKAGQQIPRPSAQEVRRALVAKHKVRQSLLMDSSSADNLGTAGKRARWGGSLLHFCLPPVRVVPCAGQRAILRVAAQKEVETTPKVSWSLPAGFPKREPRSEPKDW